MGAISDIIFVFQVREVLLTCVWQRFPHGSGFDKRTWAWG